MRRIFLILLFLLILTTGLFLFIKLDGNVGFKVVFFDVGQGDSALINFSDGTKMLIDCGKDKTILYKLGEELSFFDRQIDYLLITHFDLDHYGGCIDVLKRYDVKNLILSTVEGNDKYYEEFKKAWSEENGIKIIAEDLENLIIASSTLNFLSPKKEFNFTDKNDASIVFKLSNLNYEVLFTGDLEEKGEEKLLEKYCDDLEKCLVLESNILKVGHHGSAGSSSEDFLNAVNPQKAIISVGKNNFGHPSRRVIKKLERIKSEILRTDKIGDIIIQ